MEQKHPKLIVVGQGYVGLPLTMRAVEANYDVIGYDLDKEKISGLSVGKSHIDDVTDSDVSHALATGRYTPTDDRAHLGGFDAAIITVPTPLKDKAPDTSFIEEASSTIGYALKAGALVVLESTTYPGTTADIVAPILEHESGLTAGSDFLLGYSPERIDPGNPKWNFVNTPKVISGINGESLRAVEALYNTLVDQTVPVAGTAEAELTKLLENTFRHVNIALVNELAIHCHALGIDLWNVIDAANTKPFGFMPFYPGPGVGGHCLPVDPSYLSWQFERRLGSVSRFVKIANDINEGMPSYVVRRLQAGLNDRSKPVKGSRILVLGLAYKKNASDARETPANGVLAGLINLGADVKVHDSHVENYDLPESVERVDLTVNELASADAVLLLTDHDDTNYEDVLAHSEYILDSRRRLSGPNVESL